MNRTFLRPTSWRSLLAASAAALAALSVSAPATASSSSTGTSRAAAAAGVRLSATARRVNLRELPKSGAVGQARSLPVLRPNRSGSGTPAGTGTGTAMTIAKTIAKTAAKTTAKTTAETTASPQTVATGSTGFIGDSYTQQNNAYTSGDQGVVPPDNGTATSPQYVVEFLNDSGWVYLRNNGTTGPIFSVDLNTMFIDPADMTGCSAHPRATSPCYAFSDPRVVWDAQSGRWFASGLAFDIFNNASKEYVAVSDDWDATTHWTVNTIWSSTSYLGDQPRMGVTSDKVVDFWDDYDSPTLTFQQEEGKTVTKAALEAGAALDGTNSHDFTKKATSPSSTDGWLAVVPAWDSRTADTWAMWNDTDSAFTSPTFTADGRVHVIHITGTAASPTFAETSYLPHAGVTGGGAGMTAPQPGPTAGGPGGPTINADDDRTQTTVFDGTHLVTTANTTCGSSQICVRVFRATISGGTPTYVGDANITAAGKSVYYGAPALDGSGNLTVALSESDASSTWPSSAISGATAASPLGFSAPTIIHAGEAMYNETGFVQECVIGVYSCRWGDYQGAQPDPCDASFVWTSTEFADGNTTSAANWSSFIAPTTFGAGRVPAACGSAPTVTSLSPSCGNAGDSITISGTGFIAKSVAYFGSTLVVPTSVNGAGTSMSVTVPIKGSASVVDVTVVNGNGQSALSPADRYSYATAAPTVTGVAPNTEPADGLTAVDVTVTGTNFEYPLTVHFGSAAQQTVASSGPNATCTMVVVKAPTSSTPGAVDVTAQDGNGTSATNANDKFYYIDGGYTMDAYGGVHEYGKLQVPPHRTDGPSWPGWQIARQMVLRLDRGSGYVLDGWGGIHPFGGAPAVSGGPYWPGWDIARDIVLDPCDASQSSGYVLDGWGGVHSFGGAPAVSGGPYWPGWDIARKMVMNSCGHGGYVLDGWGGVHPFGSATPATGYPYWPGWDIARGIVLTSDGQGYVLDGWGGVHAFGGATPATGYAYWPGWDIARGLGIVPGVGGYVLDGWGGIHPFNGAAAPTTTTGYSPGHDIFRDIA